MLNIIAEEKISLTFGDTVIDVLPKGFRFQFTDRKNGVAYAPFHDEAGLLIDGEATTVAEPTKANGDFLVTTASGCRALVRFGAQDGVVTARITPDDGKPHAIELRLGGMPVAHGLGDSGGFNDSFNLVGAKPKTFDVINNGGSKRWASSFVIFPQNQIAGVYLGDCPQEVDIGPVEHTMRIRKKGVATFHYFLGDMQTIYRRYLDVRLAAGYPNIKPKFRLFELGWESWASLGWQTNSRTVRDAVGKLIDEGFPIRWLVTGSGFWQEGGTTTNFGAFGSKFPAPQSFKTWCHDRDVKWMIGLRTNFIPSGGPFVPTSNSRDRNLKTDHYAGNPISSALEAQGYFWKDGEGDSEKVTSRWYPQVPSHLIDGRIPEAAGWYAEQYKLWGVDGIKEDTMMEANIGIFNGAVSRISNDGGLVMARCGSFSAPGTLLRINDTAGANDMARRIPINYLQNAACGAPNAYSDTIGYRENPESEENLRHGWLLACTAGLAVGPFNWKSPHMRKAFKRMIQFHYEIAPTKYDSAMKSYQTGFPYTMTPLGIAYPNDENAARTPTFQWMIGESLLAAPLVKNIESNKLDIYLPEGDWYDYDSGKKYRGPTTLRNYSMPIDKTPCFVGGRGVVVTRDDESRLTARIYPVARRISSYSFTHPDGDSLSKITVDGEHPLSKVRDMTADRDINAEHCPESGAISFVILPGHEYRVKSKRQR